MSKTNPTVAGRVQDMRLALCTPQMNRLRFLVGQEIGRYVEAIRVPEYNGDEPYLIVTDEGFDPEKHGAPTHFKHPGSTYGPGDPGSKLTLMGSLLELDCIPIEQVVRSASQKDLDMLKDLKAQLDYLWSNSWSKDRVDGWEYKQDA